MKIAGHKLKDAPYRAAHSFGGEMTPTLIVVHDTAGRVTPKFSSCDWFASDDCNTSAHVVVERDGTITQMVPFNRKAWHCGPSSFKGRQGCNSFAIGIEIVNPGKLDANGRAWFHKKSEAGFEVSTLKHVKTKEHGDGYWLDYTPEQIEAVTNLCKALVEQYHLEDITAHYVISPGRKIDTNPLFPLDALRKAVLAADAETIEPMAAEPVKPVGVMQAVSGSKSALAIILTSIQLLVANFTDWMHHGWDFLLWALGVLPAITAEVKGTLSSGEEVARWLKLDWASISITLALVTLAIVFVRHLNEKRKA